MMGAREFGMISRWVGVGIARRAVIARLVVIAGRAVIARLVVIAGLTLTLACLASCSKDRLPPLTSEAIEANRSLWRSQAIASYDINVVVEGTGLEEPELIHLEVRDGKVMRALRGDLPMTGEVESYTIPGLFTTLARERELAERPESMGAPPGYRVYLHASFHPRFGYPMHYRRIVAGANRKVEMRVTGFELRG